MNITTQHYLTVRDIAFRWARIMGVESDADDIAHDAALRIMDATFWDDPSCSFESWAVVIVRNVIISLIRERVRRESRESVYALNQRMGTLPDPHLRHLLWYRRWGRARRQQQQQQRKQLRQTSDNATVVREHAPAGA